MLKKILRNRCTDQDAQGDEALIWSASMAEKSARSSGALSKEDLDRARGILRSGGHLSWEWTFRLLQMVDPTTND